jgi:isoleucyl-tRNA synthetase
MRNFKEVRSNQKFPEMEKEVISFWKENKIFEKSLENRKDAKEYSFYDGPPFATGTPHYGHIVASLLKDVVPRYWTMRGYYVERKWGWDCHGLPIENIVEKELGSKKKKDIEAMGVEKFNELCRSKVLTYVDIWEKIVERMGRWADMKNAYRTMDRDYMESVWWVFKELWDRDLIYQDYRSMHICPRCETTLSQQEVSEGYKDIKDLSVIAEFCLEDEENTSVLAWTTTPWTLPGNVALAVGENIDYVKIEKKDEGTGGLIRFILAKNKLEETFKDNEYKIVEEFKGKELVGKKYKPLFSNYLDINTDILQRKKVENGRTDVAVLVVVNQKEEVLLGFREYTKDKPGAEKDFWISPSGKVEIGETIEEAIKRELKEECNIENYRIKKYLGSAPGYADKHDLFCYLLEVDDLNQIRNNEPEKFTQWKFFSGDQLPEDQFPNPIEDKKFFIDAIKWDNAFKIYAADFVTTAEGTGVVHIAPAFGEDDMRLGKKYNLPFIQHVAMDGSFKEEMGELAGLNVKPIENPQATDVEIIKYLAKNGTLFHKEKFEHSYPHCWRCDTPLINYATSSWFVAVTKIKDEMLELAKKINWSPTNMKEGRFGNWLEGARDWSVSRQRFWASVMPIWVCTGCGEKKVFGDVAELEKLSGEKIDDLHKHIVDKITFACEKCHQGKMKRVSDVLDTWFDSGSMPYAQKHYPFENKERFEKSFPADFIAEGVDQTRAWFYYLHVIASGIKGKEAFKNVIVNGIVLAEDGKKMAKKLKNYPDPMEMFEKYGADSVRYYLMNSPVVAAQNMNFMESEVGEITRGMMRMLWNSYSFFVLYAEIDKFLPDRNFDPKKLHGLLDKWIVSELHMVIKEFNVHMENYELHKAARLLPKFVDNLSNWYIRRSRKRFWKSENDGDKNEAYQTLYYVLVELSKVMAPLTPFIAEEIYRNLHACHSGLDPESHTKNLKQIQDENCSVHLTDFPMEDESLIDEKLNENMNDLREIITLGLQDRAKKGIKVRQPLKRIFLGHKYENVFSEMISKSEWSSILTEELNVKGAEISDKTENVVVDADITLELKREGQAREIIRYIQQLRKKADYNVDDRIIVGIEGCGDVFNAHKDLIAHEVLAKNIVNAILTTNDLTEICDIDGEKVTISLKK